MNVFNKDYLFNIKNDKYFTEVVEKFIKTRNIADYIDICKVLQYRTFYIAYNVSFIDHHLRVDFKKTGYLPKETFDNSQLVNSIVLSAEVGVNQMKEEILCIFTDITKIDFKKMKVNAVRATNLNEVWEMYFSDERFGGICINPSQDAVPISYGYLKYILDNNFNAIEESLNK